MHRRSGSAGSVSSSLFSSATRSATAFSMLSSRLRLLIEPRPAWARTLVAVNRQLFQGDQFFGDQPGHALGQQAIQQRRILAPKLGQQIVVDRRTAAQPAIGRVLLTQAVDRPRRTDPLQCRVQPDRQHHLRIGCRPSGNRVTRLDPVVKLAQIQTFNKRPNQPRPMVVRQLAIQIDHVPAQLSPVWTDHPHTFVHSGPPLPPLIGLYRTRGAKPSDQTRNSNFFGIGLRPRRPGVASSCGVQRLP